MFFEILDDDVDRYCSVVDLDVLEREPAVAEVAFGIAGFSFAQMSMGLMPLLRSPSSTSIIFTTTAVVSNARV